jgi:hypothetical protein
MVPITKAGLLALRKYPGNVKGEEFFKCKAALVPI